MIKAKKSLGQNFLASENIAKNIAETGQIERGETVLEIGPGRGMLTKHLLALGARVFAIEKDNELIEFLDQKFAPEIRSGALKITEGDVLNFDPSNLGSYKLIANIPYYITGFILEKFLSAKNQPKKIVMLVQKEVAKRILALDGKESILSVSVKIYGKPKILRTVKKGSFVPVPKVDSAILAIDDISKENFNKTSEQKFFEILRAGFAHKRKKLSSNLQAVCPNIKNILTDMAKNSNVRAEELNADDWKQITLQCLS